MTNIVVPELGESVVEARIARWLKKAGDQVEVGDPLVELETEKTNLELSAEKRGVITSIARKEGEDVKIGELLAVVDENGAAPRRRHAAANSAPKTPRRPPKASRADDRADRTDSEARSHRQAKRGSHRPRESQRSHRRAKRRSHRQAQARSHRPKSAIAPKSACA